MPVEVRGRSFAAPPMLDPGSLWHVGTIVGRATVDLPNGGQEVTDVDIVVDEPMSIAPLSARERAEAGGIMSEATHVVRFYWVAGVRASQSIRVRDPYEDRDRTFEIIAVLNPEERALLLDVHVVEKV
jgi:hypothetical protein